MSESAAETTRSGDGAAAVVAVWFDRHVDAVHAYAARRVGREVASEVTAETFRTALEFFDRYDSQIGGERAWLYGIASNLLRRHWRVEERRLRAYARHEALSRREAIDPLLAVDDRVDAGRRFDPIVAAIERLEPVDRDLLFLVAWERCTSAEAAGALGLPPSTIRRRLQRIRAELRRVEGTTE
ncbi:MAG: hypothetical protein RL238_3731 [Actinomycetota bacterium]|jgi:RNA polymerase sigma factor (sigma-70 family)